MAEESEVSPPPFARSAHIRFIKSFLPSKKEKTTTDGRLKKDLETSSTEASAASEQAELTARKAAAHAEGGADGGEEEGMATGKGSEKEPAQKEAIQPQKERKKKEEEVVKKKKKKKKKKGPSFAALVTEYLRMSGLYWGAMALELVAAEGEEALPGDDIVKFVLASMHPFGGSSDEAQAETIAHEFTAALGLAADPLAAEVLPGGFGGSPGHDPHLLYTCSAVQLLAIFDRLDVIDRDAVAKQIASHQRKDGSFQGDKWGEVDTRFSYCAVLALSILGKLELVDKPAAVRYLSSCRNFDSGYGCVAGAESHAGMIFVCVAALSLLHSLDEVDRDGLSWWLCERQCDSGGLNGRPEKQADVCYSWWILSVLSILGRTHWLDRGKLRDFILHCQDPEDGGIADRPDNMPDPFRTYFGTAGLVFLGYFRDEGRKHKEIDPAYALPVDVVERLGLRPAQRLLSDEEGSDGARAGAGKKAAGASLMSAAAEAVE